ncbi:MAG: hypothetical protein UT84_C0001G0041 [Candidatus Curtissbacteria bacterium GW2011_GWA1_40_16]|uniref:Integral membrane protein TIGR01906 n=1 Tax=Candidatus Curtissbacteria bacterium GW2011_GWA1_40_16 TaxID=1618405 RepID=A0A0G0RN83_9BACT|nr:MAG: hypothetical protein UT84_C0001G0041 [Candidatus Curtissbacteria bacterium GW2011_GWA1_40_16]
MKYLSILIIVLIPVTIILINISILAKNYNFYLTIYKTQNIYNNFPNESILDSATKNLIDYFRNKNILDQNYYSGQAQIHLKDVKYLLNIVSITSLIVITTVFFLNGLFVYKKELKRLTGSLVKGGLATIILTIIISAFLIFNFQGFFIDFHKIFFRNNYWLFDESDNLIKMFPERFFMYFSYVLIGNIIITSLVLILSATIIRKINDKPHI